MNQHYYVQARRIHTHNDFPLFFYPPPKKEVLTRIFLLMQYGNKKCYIHKKTKFTVIPPIHYKLLFFLTLLKKTVLVTFLRSTAIWFIPSCIKKKVKIISNYDFQYFCFNKEKRCIPIKAVWYFKLDV